MLSQCFLFGPWSISGVVRRSTEKGTFAHYMLTKPALCMYGLHSLASGICFDESVKNFLSVWK